MESISHSTVTATPAVEAHANLIGSSGKAAATEQIAVGASIGHKYTLKDSVMNVFSAKFSPDGNFIAASFADGTLHVHTVFKGDRVFVPKVQKRAAESLDPRTPREIVIKPIITSICWRPT